MIAIIKDRLSKIALQSESLSRTEKYINKPWVHIDFNGNYHKYIFKADGTIFMAFNGDVQLGKWEYLPEANLIFIDRLTDKTLLKQSFFDESLMILKIDGKNDDMFILVNENIIPDFDIVKYLDSLNSNSLISSSNINFYQKKLINGDTLSIDRENFGYTKKGMIGFLNNTKIPNGEYFAESEFSNKLLGYEFYDSKVTNLFWGSIFETSKGVFKIYQKDEYGYSIGDNVLLNDKTVPNGKYKLKFMSYISITNGVISDHSVFG